MRTLPLAVILSLGLLPARLPAEPGRQDFQALIDEYRRGNAEAVVVQLAALGSREAERLRPSRSVAEAPWDWAASILLRAEARHRRYFDSTGALWLADRDENPHAVEDRWQMPSLRALRELLDVAAATSDERLRAYCREWYLTTLQGFSSVYLDESLDLFPRDATVLLARGRHYEFTMGPETEGPIGAFWFIAGASRVTADGALVREELTVRTPHGLFGADTSQRAIDTYRAALELDPELTEARLRLGRVLYLMDRNRDALRELGRALDDARRRGELGTAYLAALFAGQVHEFDGRPEEAAASFREAIAACPRCPSAPSALLRLYLTTGSAAQGWQAMDDLFQHADAAGAVATDPWVAYTIPPWSFILVQRYTELRAWIRIE